MAVLGQYGLHEADRPGLTAIARCALIFPQTQMKFVEETVVGGREKDGHEGQERYAAEQGI